MSGSAPDRNRGRTGDPDPVRGLLGWSACSTPSPTGSAAPCANLRGKGRLSDADIDATAREIRIALLEADVALPVVRAFIARIKERAKGAEVSGALNPAQQVVKIVNEELIDDPRRRDPAAAARQAAADA